MLCVGRYLDFELHAEPLLRIYPYLLHHVVYDVGTIIVFVSLRVTSYDSIIHTEYTSADYPAPLSPDYHLLGLFLV